MINFRAEVRQPLLSAKLYLPIKSRMQKNISFYQKDSLAKSVLPSRGGINRQNMLNKFTAACQLQQTRSLHEQHNKPLQTCRGVLKKFLRDTYIGFKHGIEKKSTSVFYTVSQEESIKGLFLSLLYSIAFLALQFRISTSFFTWGYSNIFSQIPFFIIIIIYIFFYIQILKNFGNFIHRKKIKLKRLSYFKK